jgi:putative transposase
LRPARRRELVDHLRAAWRVSVRRACQVLRASRSTYQYKSRGGSQDELRQRIREIAETRVRYGYRRIHVLLQREGWAVNAKRVYRLYREMGLQLRNKTPKRKVKAKLRVGRSDPAMANDVWAMDFVHDQLYDGRRLRILTVIDAFTRYVPAIEPRERFTGADVVGVLERICARHGHPRSIRVDQGPEFISRDLDLWAYANGVELDFSRPGKPTDNAFIESLNGKFRAECLNAHWFMNLADARGKCERWRRDYNTERPHSAIGYRTPAEARNASGLTQPALAP